MKSASADDRDDTTLVAAAQRGDKAALEVLLVRHHDRLHAICWRLTGNDADAADANQEALIAIVRGLPRFDGRSQFSTWSYRIAVNACLDELRRRRRRPVPVEDSEAPLVGAAGAVASVASVTSVTDDPAGGAATRIDIDAALLQLPVEFRAAVVLRDLCGLDYAEIADILDIPPGTVRSRIARGRAALVPLLGPAAAGNPADHPDRPTPYP